VDGESEILYLGSRTHGCLTGLPVTYQTLTEHSVYDNGWNDISNLEEEGGQWL